MLNWANRFNIFCLLDNSGYQFEKPSFDWVLAAGCSRSVHLTHGNAYSQLKDFYDAKPSWLFGHLGYDLKNEIAPLSGPPADAAGFGEGFFFEPEILLRYSNGILTVESESRRTSDVLADIEKEEGVITQRVQTNASIQQSISKEEYLKVVNKLKEHIRRGDCYEINFCQHFFAEQASIDPLYVYSKLAEASPNPFAALYKLNESYCLCASPERYLKKSGSQLLSQPIKGTSKRDLDDPVNDQASIEYLLNSAKEKSENVMVVDLVRNDLSKVCEEGSVYVSELFGIYSFPQVHQMISSIRGTATPGLHWTELIRASFPMGSMTGAPKLRVMQLIDAYESTGRGLFSGAIGYITPGQDFDFNVVIRSIFYNDEKKYLSFFAGSGLTFYSDPEAEYDECLLKAEAIMQVLRS